MAERPARHSVSFEMSSFCCTNNANRSHVGLRREHFQRLPRFIPLYLHLFVHKSYNYRTTCVRCRGCHQQTSVQPTLLISTGSQLWSSDFDYNQSCVWHRVFLRQRTVVDADDRGGWTQLFSGKATEQETFQPVEKRNFYLPTCIWRPR